MSQHKIKGTACCIALLFAAFTTPMFGADAFSTEEIAQTCVLNQLDKPIKAVRQNKPILPAELKDIRASVQVAFIIDEHGRVTKPRILKCSNESFKNIALENAASWLFEPGTKAGNPVAIRVVVPMRFNSSTN